MNNLTFGNDTHQYYETICSGAPAGPGIRGADAVQVHMTNSRMTDPEVLEFRYPVVVEEFSIRRGSGGQGRWSAGDGTRRTIRFLEPMDMAILSSSRQVAPNGLSGGGNGKTGETWIQRRDGRIDRLAGCDQRLVDAGRFRDRVDAHGRRVRANARQQRKLKIARPGIHVLTKTWISATFVPVPPVKT